MSSAKNSLGSAYSDAKKILGRIIMFFYNLRKLVMALPVFIASVRLAAYSLEHLPNEVGLFLQTNGDFLQMIDRNTAVIVPMLITMGCLFMMFLSRKAAYAWAISIFSLALPLLILFSNNYPA